MAKKTAVQQRLSVNFKYIEIEIQSLGCHIEYKSC